MNNRKKLLSLLLAAVLIAASFAVGIIAYAGSPVAINAVNFPDENFRTIVSMECDEDEDGYLSDAEIADVTLFSVTGYLYDLDEGAEIHSLKGIEYFTNLKTLRCGGIGLETLDVKKLTALTWLDCMGNDLTELDVSRNTALRVLNCQSNDLETLDVSALPSLTELSCSINHLTALNVTNNTNLEKLQVNQNQLTSLDVSRNTKLTSLHCSNNHIQELDLSANTALNNVLSDRIGNQTIEGEAEVNDGDIFVVMPFNARTRIISTSLDYTDPTLGPMLGYQNDAFVTDDYLKLENGIDYEYDTGIDGAEPMTVHVNVSREFYYVRFYTNENKTTVLKTQIVDRGASATAPMITDSPMCKTFTGWDTAYDNILQDTDVCATWRDDHVFSVVSFEGNEVIMECQNGCGTRITHNFAKVVGAEIGDEEYNEALDINADGIINGRDLARFKLRFSN